MKKILNNLFKMTFTFVFQVILSLAIIKKWWNSRQSSSSHQIWPYIRPLLKFTLCEKVPYTLHTKSTRIHCKKNVPFLTHFARILPASRQNFWRNVPIKWHIFWRNVPGTFNDAMYLAYSLPLCTNVRIIGLIWHVIFLAK